MKLLLWVFVPERLSCGLRGQLDLATQIVDPSDETQDHLLAVAASEVAGAEILVRERTKPWEAISRI